MLTISYVGRIVTCVSALMAPAAFGSSLSTGGGPETCPGDCNGNSTVDVAEVVHGVAVALNRGSIDECRSLDLNGDGELTIAELVTLVDYALRGCPCSGDAGELTCGGRCPDGTVCGADPDLDACACVEPVGWQCGGTFPTCNGRCPRGTRCALTGDDNPVPCACLEEEATPCKTLEDATCGGACPIGQQCAARGDACVCQKEGICGDGFFEREIAGISVGCYPSLCLDQPCGSRCGPGRRCSLIVGLEGEGSDISFCVCASEQILCGKGGVTCPAGETCVEDLTQRPIVTECVPTGRFFPGLR